MALEDAGLEEGNISESISEASEADLQRVRDNAKKGKQVKAQIQKVQKQNKHFAQMLTLLLQLIDDDKLLGFVFTQLIDYQVAIPAIFAQFLPYLQHRIDIEIYKNMYGSLWDVLPREENLINLVGRLRTIKASSKSLQTIEKESYYLFVVSYLSWYGLIDMKSLDEKQKKELEEGIRSEMGI